jgi:O-antigen/teichoic acid export membrane protein
MKRNFLDFTKAFSFITFPLILLVIPFSDYLIYAAFGSNWDHAILPFQILSLYACLRSVTANRGAVLNALHQNKRVFRMVVIYTPVHIITSFISSYYFGVIGVATNLLVIRAVYSLYGIKETMGFIDGTLGDFFSSFKKTLWINAIVLALCFPLVHFDIWDQIKDILPNFIFNSDAIVNAILFILGILFALICYYLFGLWFYKNEIIQVCRFISRVFPKFNPILKKFYSFNPE